MSPNLQVVSESKEAEVDQRIWKIILLAFFGVATSVMSVSGFNRLLLGGGSYYLWAALAALIAFLIITLLQVFLVKELRKFFFIALLDAATPLLLLTDKIYPKTSWILVAGAAVVFIFLFSVFRAGRKNLENSMTIRFFENSKRILPRMAVGFLLLFSVLFYLNYFEWGNFNPQLGKAVVTNLLITSEPIVNILIPNISFKGTVGDFFKTMATSQLRDSNPKFSGLAGQNIENQFRYLPPKEQEKLISQVADQFQDFFASRFSPLNKSDKVTDAAFSVIEKYFSQFLNSSSWTVPWIISFLFFLFLKSVFILLYWFIASLALLIFKILLAFNFAHITSEGRRREFTLLS